MEECKEVLTWEQKIQNIENAPEEARLMIAKAYIRDDIPDENVQYEFNTDSPEQLNEDGEIENLNADDPEGIGATGFTMRTTRPANNKNFITRGSGGWNTCIKGNPRYQYADALANCVGYASGRFNEIINIARETTGCTYTTLNCNAVGFKERAEAAGLKTGSTPRRGAIMCWGKEGAAGHVAIVERVNNSNSVYTSESGWGSSAIFWNSTRSNNNGRWGIGAGYYFRCFIYLPDDVQKAIDAEEPTPTPQPTPSDKFNIGDKVVVNGPLYVSSTASSPAGHVSNKVTNITRKNPGSAHPYNTTGDLGWMDESSIKKYEEPTPAPTPTPAPSTELNVGDAVEIIGTGNGSAYGGSNTAYGIGWKRQILKIWNGKPYPYQVGNNTGTTGFYKKEALKKI
jgi:surface antigen|uniref:CHAP domain protein n=1 Tax=Myoviridae sp. ctTYJ16 TaxID=2825112 RepID=A0A8S5P9X6_9CAUD|nr:MAG TPA: CHAP domain protein [Myoviridae sp. ctTYJ16]